jgi:hypothetical protein
MQFLLLIGCIVALGSSYSLMSRAKRRGLGPVQRAYPYWRVSTEYAAWIKEQQLRDSIELSVFLELGRNKRR